RQGSRGTGARGVPPARARGLHLRNAGVRIGSGAPIHRLARDLSARGAGRGREPIDARNRGETRRSDEAAYGGFSMRTLIGLILCASLHAAAGPMDEADALYLRRDLSGNLEKSNEMLKEMLASQPTNAQSWWRLGRGLERLGER